MRRHAAVSAVVAVLFALLAASSASADFSYQGTFSSEGSGDGQLSTPGRAAVEQATGHLFVVDSDNNRVQVFAPNAGGGAEYLTQFGAGELSAPWGIAISESGGQTSVYVADAGNDRIVKYDSDEATTPSFTLDPSPPISIFAGGKQVELTLSKSCSVAPAAQSSLLPRPSPFATSHASSAPRNGARAR